MSNYEQNTKHTQWQETQSKDTEQTSDSDMAGMFEFSDHDVKRTIMLRALMGKNRQH